MITIDEIDEYVFETFVERNGCLTKELNVTIRYSEEPDDETFEILDEKFDDVHCEAYNEYHSDKALINLNGITHTNKVLEKFYNALEKFIEEEYESVLDREHLDYDVLISAVKRLEEIEKKYYNVYSLANSDKDPNEIVEKIRELLNIKKV